MKFSLDRNRLINEIKKFAFEIHDQAYHFLGSKRIESHSNGYQFSVWAPKAWQVYLLGDFSNWENLPMERVEGGVWTLFVEKAQAGQCYKYGIDHGNNHIEYKIDPYAIRFETPPQDASIIEDLDDYYWKDHDWLQKRKLKDKYASPLQIYEVHLSSWRQHPDGRHYSFKELAHSLVPYVKEMGYTHIEFMPLTAFPYPPSWGYQVTGYYAVAGQYGRSNDFKYFVDFAHQEGIGVILDWVPGHFNRNANALAYFDGHACYEYQDAQKAENYSWGSLNFDLGKLQVQSFLISNLNYWLTEFHLDGIRADAISNILYLDFDQGPWTPNQYGSNENLEGFAFLQMMNQWVQDYYPDVYMIAEEATSSSGITLEIAKGGLGFDYKWNMGWMNDVLRFFQLPYDQRPNQLRLITFVFMYQFKERYLLPFSHDEVVHGKKSLLAKMPGDRYDQFADLRLLHAYMLAQPGKQLHFMGNELGQFLEWRYYEELDWKGLSREYNSEYQTFIRTINTIGLERPEFYQLDHSPKGITILDADDLTRGLLSLIRWSKDKKSYSIIMINFSKNHYYDVEIGVPESGEYKVYLNSQAQEFAGYQTDWLKTYHSFNKACQKQDYSCLIEVPALSVQFIEHIYYQDRKEKGANQLASKH
ncbi:1,4-alpha-glucan branching protein GlgB [Facklamia miroungae]|uniref:1,4-alpha-glucan branching enzyme n=1 Tax=Facklamia miroungae TaxID=120956 RepID=A0A1G7QTV0_9LACT|nr:1,4-alpha-glucan branching protein GlgB [Facklamia miroungae]NKZ29063.1 1,4-alpha-glucan branching protein GlgB [Facklamia miroungae]SDG01942.1 1,4-alpha-glucan branching enzyme [Facklamia miroungae]